jgi:hypothetical protein
LRGQYPPLLQCNRTWVTFLQWCTRIPRYCARNRDMNRFRLALIER